MMKQVILKGKQAQKGLTLIELLAVLVIVGIVAAIAIPAIGGVLTGSKDKADASTETMLQDAAKRFLVDYEMNTAPITNARIVVLTSTLQTKGYIESVPASQQAAGKNFEGLCMDKVNGNWVVCPVVAATGALATGSAPVNIETAAAFTLNATTQEWGKTVNTVKIINNAYLVTK